MERSLFEPSATLLVVGTPVISLAGIFFFIFIFILGGEPCPRGYAGTGPGIVDSLMGLMALFLSLFAKVERQN